MSLGSANLQSSPKIFETSMNVPFPLQCGHVTAKLRGYNNMAKGRVKRKEAELSKVIHGFCLRS